MEEVMGAIEAFTPEKLVCGILVSREELLAPARERLCARFGPVDYEGGPFPFTFTGYYDDEMGTPITRYFLSFERLLAPDALAEVKVFTNETEDLYAENGKRRVNLDPGLISLKRLILASTKDNGRRVPLSKGIYAEITLIFTDGAFRALPWTYPDYRSSEYLKVMSRIREIYKSQLKQL